MSVARSCAIRSSSHSIPLACCVDSLYWLALTETHSYSEILAVWQQIRDVSQIILFELCDWQSIASYFVVDKVNLLHCLYDAAADTLCRQDIPRGLTRLLLLAGHCDLCSQWRCLITFVVGGNILLYLLPSFSDGVDVRWYDCTRMKPMIGSVRVDENGHR